LQSRRVPYKILDASGEASLDWLLSIGRTTMRNTFLFGAAALAALLGGLSATRADDAKKSADKGATTAFFDGKTLDGWEGLPEYWSVKDGAIVGAYTNKSLTHNTFLWSKKSYKDFEMSFKIRLKEGVGNSGVQIRSKIHDMKELSGEGPQCDIGQAYWGSLYGENFGGMMKASNFDEVKKTLKPNDFNDYHIKVVGKHVTIKLNGETTVDEDFAKLPDDGKIGWQLHAGFPFMEVTFKDIHFKELGAEK
jgi:hypothetical protein